MNSLLKFTVLNLCMCCFLCLCAQTSENEQMNDILLEEVEKISFNNDSVIFQFFDLRNLNEGYLFNYTYPLLDLSLIDLKKPEKIQKISEAGSGPSQFNSYLEAIVMPNQDVCVLQSGTESKIYFFGANHQFLKSIPLNKLLNGYFVAPFDGQIQYRIDTEKETLKLYISISNPIHHSEKNYYKGYSLAELGFSINDYELIQHQLVVPYELFHDLQNSIAKNQKSWKMPSAYFTITEDKQFIKFNFSDKIYEFDKDWQMLTETPVSFQHKSIRYTTKFGFENDVTNRLHEEAKLHYSNPSINYIESYGNLIFITANIPVDPENVPRTIEGRRESKIVNHEMQVINIETADQFAVNLPVYLTAYRFNVISNDEIIFASNPQTSEEFALFKFKYTLLK